MSNLLNQQAAFNKRLASQPLLKRATAPSTSPTPGSLDHILNKPAAKSKPINPEFATSKPHTKKPSNIGTLVYNVLKWLKGRYENDQTATFTASEIQEETKIDVTSSSILFQEITKNERIQYDEGKSTFQYKPPYQITSPESLLSVIRTKHETETSALEVKDLRESCPSIEPFLNDLISTNDVIVIRDNKSGAPKVVYYNDRSYETVLNGKIGGEPYRDWRKNSISGNLTANGNANGSDGVNKFILDEEFEGMWHKVKIANDEVQLEKELEKAGLTSMQTTAPTSSKKSKKDKERKKRKTRIKITNVHMAEILGMNMGIGGTDGTK
ncbi:hypothetical protein BKA69DRAFT_1086345 [Paraphysoderma sedebokerense]|nr:hypothetical protein BKA69DRAFT_1086345 [Paraphysoderma sedebokerense]